MRKRSKVENNINRVLGAAAKSLVGLSFLQDEFAIDVQGQSRDFLERFGEDGRKDWILSSWGLNLVDDFSCSFF